MAYKIKDKEKFVELRAEGLSFDNISKAMNISKPTLIQWNVSLAREIENKEFLEYQSLLDKYKLSKRKQLEYFSTQLNKIHKELSQRDLSQLTIREIIALNEVFENGVLKILKSVKYNTGKEKPQFSIVGMFEDDEIRFRL